MLEESWEFAESHLFQRSYLGGSERMSSWLCFGLCPDHVLWVHDGGGSHAPSLHKDFGTSLGGYTWHALVVRCEALFGHSVKGVSNVSHYLQLGANLQAKDDLWLLGRAWKSCDCDFFVFFMREETCRRARCECECHQTRLCPRKCKACCFVFEAPSGEERVHLWWNQVQTNGGRALQAWLVFPQKTEKVFQEWFHCREARCLRCMGWPPGRPLPWLRLMGAISRPLV